MNHKRIAVVGGGAAGLMAAIAAAEIEERTVDEDTCFCYLYEL